MSRRRDPDLGTLSPAEAAMAAADVPDRLCITEAEWNSGARVADDCHCPGCGRRGFVFTCPTCEAAR